jgi:hypothetical protein
MYYFHQEVMLGKSSDFNSACLNNQNNNFRVYADAKN